MTAEDERLVQVERDGPLAVVTLNRPEAMNALSAALRAAIARTFTDLQQDRGVEVVILTGAGRAFCAGLDLKELGGERPAGVATDNRDLYRAIDAFDRPIIGAINGFAVTGGFEIALLCDLLIASTAARFADTHARVGVVPGWGLSQKLPRLIGPLRAKELSLTGNYIDAATADAWGLVNRVVAPDALLPTCLALARDMLETDRTTREAMLGVIDQGWQSTLGEGLIIEAEANRQHQEAEVRPEKVRARRAAIQRRGRTQQGSN